MQNIMKKILLFMLGGLTVATVSSFNSDIQSTEINVWYKVSTDMLDPGEIIPLDMSKGYSFCDASSIYIVVNELGTKEGIMIAFPNGGYWDSPGADPFLEELQEEFNSLEEYLKNKDSIKWQKR